MCWRDTLWRRRSCPRTALWFGSRATMWFEMAGSSRNWYQPLPSQGWNIFRRVLRRADFRTVWVERLLRLRNLTFAQSLLTHMRIQGGEFGLGFHKIQHLDPADAITVSEVLINRSEQLQLLGRVESPTLVAVIHFFAGRDHFE